MSDMDIAELPRGSGGRIMSDIPQRLIALIHSSRINLTNEKEAQAEIHALLKGTGLHVVREARLSHRDVPDFMVFERPGQSLAELAPGVAVEIKVKGAKKMDVFRQLTRYAQHPSVKELLLVTSLAMGLPPTIEGKPAYYASLGRGWM